MAKMKAHKPAKRPRKTKTERATETLVKPESAQERAERAAAVWAKSIPSLVKRAAEFVEKHEAERAELAAARKKIDRYIAIRDSQIAPPWKEGKNETPHTHAGTKTTDPAAQNNASNTATKTWITNEAQQMKEVGEIPAGIKITHFAQQLEKRMAKANRNDPSIRGVSWRYIKNELPGWGLWPISQI